MRYMLDTNICIYLLNEQPPHVFERFMRLDVGDVVMSCITLAELRHGASTWPKEGRHDNQAALDALLDDIPALPFGEAAARSSGLLASLSKLKPDKAIDNLIAAHAISLGAVLVTNNERDFRGYASLAVENWVLKSIS